jgi:hypothetical protein
LTLIDEYKARRSGLNQDGRVGRSAALRAGNEGSGWFEIGGTIRIVTRSGNMSSLNNLGGNADDRGVGGHIAQYNSAGSYDGGLPNGDTLNDRGPNAYEGRMFNHYMPREFDAGADMGRRLNDGLVIDDAPGVEDDRVLDANMCANICSCGNYDIFTDARGIGDGGGRMNRADETDTGFFEDFDIISTNAVVTNGDDDPANGQFGEARYKGDISEDLDIVDGFVVEGGIGIEEASDLELVVISEDVEDHAAMTTGTEDSNSHNLTPRSWWLRAPGERDFAGFLRAKPDNNKSYIGEERVPGLREIYEKYISGLSVLKKRDLIGGAGWGKEGGGSRGGAISKHRREMRLAESKT